LKPEDPAADVRGRREALIAGDSSGELEKFICDFPVELPEAMAMGR